MSQKKRNRGNRPRRSSPPAESGAARPSLAFRPVMAYGRWLAASAGVALVVGGVLLYTLFGVRKAIPPDPPAAQFVGGQACAACHAQEYEAWRGSHHAQAMQEATTQTVLGDFGDARFTDAGVTSTFFRRGGRFYVNTDGPDGAMHDYEITYTFGVTPLQQYLVEFPGGRLQALSIAWDTRPKEAGGQRWFHLYPGEVLRSPDPLHWTGPEQTWNYQCAECHSTDLHKNYDVGQNRYATTWAEIMVSCEACHGPGSAHAAWAQARPAGAPRTPAATTGLTVRLVQGDGGWVVQDLERGIAAWSGPQRSTAEVDACARCHARRRPIVDPYAYGRPLLDTHMPALLDAGRRGLLTADKALATLATDENQPGIARATALALLREYLSQETLPAVEAALGDADPLVRATALAALESLPTAERVQLAALGLRDTVRAVRLAAARALAGSPQQALSPAQQADFARALEEFVAAEMVNADEPAAHLNLANFYMRLGRAAEAESELRTTLVLDPRFVPALVNMADLFRAQGRNGDSERALEQALQVALDSAEALHALGLLRVRRGRLAEAVDLLRRAAQRQPESTHFAYVYAVALYETGEPARAVAVLEDAHRRRPANRDVLIALVSYLQKRGDKKAALRYAERLATLAAEDREVQAMVESLRRQAGSQ